MATYAGVICKFSQAEIKNLFDRSVAITRCAHYTLLGASRTREFARILIVISRRVGSAVVRNRLRRRIKAMYYQQRWYERCPLDMVLIAQPVLATLSYAELEQRLQASLEKACLPKG